MSERVFNVLFADSAAVTGGNEAKRKAFAAAYKLLQRRISLFAFLPFATLNAIVIKNELDQIGRMHEKGL